MKKRSEEARERGDEDAGEMAREGRGCSSPPPSLFFIPEANEAA